MSDVENSIVYRSTKKYVHSVGLSCAFRQWRAHSHCNKLHGYPLAFKFVFEGTELDQSNWVVDFGSLKSMKGMLEDTFDHKTVVAKDDPEMDWFEEGNRRGIIDLVVLEGTGCEMFAKLILEYGELWLKDNGYSPRAKLISVEVSEHESNSAIAERI